MLNTLYMYMGGIFLAIILHIIALRATTWATDCEYVNPLSTKPAILVHLIRFFVWLTWVVFALVTGSPVFTAMAVGGVVLYAIAFSIMDETPRNIKNSKFLSFMNEYKLLPWRHHQISPIRRDSQN